MLRNVRTEGEAKLDLRYEPVAHRPGDTSKWAQKGEREARTLPRKRYPDRSAGS